MTFCKLLICSIVCSNSSYSAGDSINCGGKYVSDSLKHGVWICRKGNKILRKERYKKGRLTSYILFDENGKIRETRNRKGKIRTYKNKACGC